MNIQFFQAMAYTQSFKRKNRDFSFENFHRENKELEVANMQLQVQIEL